jgi:hypothetical protein
MARPDLTSGPQLPSNLIQDLPDLGSPIVTGRFEGAFLSAAQAISQGPVAESVDFVHKTYDQHFNPGEMLTEEQLKEKGLFREGINYGKRTSENVAKLLARRADDKQEVDSMLGNMPDGVLSSVSRGVGSLVGFAADPINYASGMAIEGIAAKGASKLLPILAESIPAGNRNRHSNMGCRS